MVSFWPWKGNGSSPSSFEKTLSTLSKKIAATQLQLDQQRSKSRRIKVLWTLYFTFAYLVYAIVLVLVVGWHNLGPWEWTGLTGGPVLIYLMRTLTSAYFTFRIDTLETRLKDQQTERATTIQKLKEATKYDTTLELLEKYGGEKPKRRRAKSGPAPDDNDDTSAQKTPGQKPSRQTTPHAGDRIYIQPPPTANIQRPPSAAGTPPRQHQGPLQPPPHPPSPIPHDPTAEFAPNAGELPPTYPQYEFNTGPPRWYDRILDLMMGEDETAPKNRIVLICQKCRLVNGQAPPGVRSLTEIGQWKCMSCHALNGEMDEGKKIIQEALGKGVSRENESEASSDDKAMTDESAGEYMGNEGSSAVQEQEPIRRSNRNKSQMVP